MENREIDWRESNSRKDELLFLPPELQTDQIMKSNVRKLVSNGQYARAIAVYGQAHTSSLQPNDPTFPTLLKACKNLRSIPQTQQIHTHVVKTGFEADIYTATSLTATYMKLHLFGDALKVFETISSPCIASYNSIISGFSQCGNFQESLYAFRQLVMEGLCPNSVTVASALPACGTMAQGSQLHGFSIRMGFELDAYVATALVTMYSNCAQLNMAQRVFELFGKRKVVTYNAMISGFLKDGSSLLALDVFREMTISTGERPSSSTLLSVLSACSELSDLMLGKQIHCYILKCELDSEVMVGTTLIHMYSKCGSWCCGYRIFSGMKNRNIVSWNAMISGLLSHGFLDPAVELFNKLRSEGPRPDAVTWNLMISAFSQSGNGVEAFKLFGEMQSAGTTAPTLKILTSLLQACSSISDLQHGKEIHCHVLKTGECFKDEFFQAAVIHMYMSCGCSRHARRIFYQIDKKSGDPALWNAMISGHGRNGEHELALEIFEMMRRQRVIPNSATFLSVLSACSHTGQIEKAHETLEMMSRDYKINLTAEHYGCMIDLLSRAGKLEEAWYLLQKVPMPSNSMYSSLLGACRSHSNAELGEVMVREISELEPWCPTPFVIMSDIYAEQGRWDDVQRLRKMKFDRRLTKAPGCSWIKGAELSP